MTNLGDCYIALNVGPYSVQVAAVSVDGRICQSTNAYMKMAAKATGAGITDENPLAIPTPDRHWSWAGFTADDEETYINDLVEALKREAAKISWVSTVLVGHGCWPTPPAAE